MNVLETLNTFDRPAMGNMLVDWMDEECDLLTNTTTYGARPAIVDSCPDTLRQFVQTHQFEVDHSPFQFDGREYLLPIFEDIRFDQGDHFSGVLMTGAQVAKSITAMLALTMATLKFWGKSFGYFLPDQDMAMIFSSRRFYPLVCSCLALRAMIGQDPVTGKKLEDRKRVRAIGRSTVFFSYMGGKTSTEALPMQGAWFDEVRRMAMQDVERASERTSGQSYPLNFKLSTAKHPDGDIDYFYKRSSMGKWHSTCRCAEGVVLADTFPECIGERKGEVFYRCPKCDARIEHPVQGRMIHHQPELRRAAVGWNIPQLLSAKLWPAPRFWKKWLNATDRAEFYNSGLGKPYLDPDSILVPLDVAMACVDPNLTWQGHGTNCVMGIDQRGQENHVVIGWVGPTKVELRHIEMIQADDPFERMCHLMYQYDVDCCVGDALPNYNDAVRFAKKFPRRVFLSYYSDNLHMIRWSDRDEELKALVRTSKDAKFEWHVMLDRYKVIEWALMHWVHRQVACPNPHGLVQEVRVKGMKAPVELCLGNPDKLEPGLFWHLRSISKRKVEIERRDSVKADTLKTGEFKMIWENISIDPHFVHAFTYMLVAGARKQITGQILLLDMPGTTPPMPTPAAHVQHDRPDLTPEQAGTVAQLDQGIHRPIQQLGKPGTCGGCANFSGENQPCLVRQFLVQGHLPVGNCWEYIDRGEE